MSDTFGQKKVWALAASSATLGASLMYLFMARRGGRSSTLSKAASTAASKQKPFHQAADTSLMQRMDAYNPPNTTFITPWEESKTDEQNGFISLQPYEFKNAYKFFISAVVPRPIALVSSQDAQGNINLAPFSFFTFVSYNPPICVFSCVDKGRQGGDTLKNIKQTGEFVVHIISEWYVEGANHCSGNFAADVNEFERAGLTATPSTVVQPPRVAESALAFECKLERLTALEKDLLDTDKGTGATVVYGKIVRVHCNKAIIADDSNLEENDITVALEKLKPVSRLGGNDYGLSREAFTLTRPPAN